ncbi:MAG: sigma-70 family RNA polymerase sigma factor [Pseudomonadota bacterium]|nr:sigma-70 family RNA polymerase sigma factor [Pseudomonadota bacterium]
MSGCRSMLLNSDLNLETAFRDHHASLVKYLRRRVGSEADARDIAQDAYLQLLRYRQQEDSGALKALLFRIASNLVGMRARRARARRWADHESLDEAHALSADEPPHDQRLMDVQRLDLLMKAIERLPRKCQQVFVLSRFHHMAYPQIAEHCGISVKMVEKHITRALELCRAEVGDDPA